MTGDDGFDVVGAESAFVEGTTDEMSESLGLDGAFLLHFVEIDPLTEFVANGDGIGGEPRQTKVGPLCRCKDLWRSDERERGVGRK